MPIPPFDAITGVLPPHLGDPRIPTDLAPYPCTILEFCNRFGTSPERRRILEGYLELRQDLNTLGIEGYQWLNGSFLEDVEGHSGRPPGDIDVITFVAETIPSADLAARLMPTGFPWFDNAATKARYGTDHFFVPLSANPRRLVYNARYWYGLFSHQRGGVWKGMLEVEFQNLADDTAARAVLRGTP
jgi:hypothetical protein